MKQRIEIENIEQLRRNQGIDDIDLRHEIQTLGTGDVVRLTLVTATKSSGGETVLVRVTRVRGATFSGRLASRPTSTDLADLDVGAAVAFTAEHIHSVPKGPSRHDR